MYSLFYIDRDNLMDSESRFIVRENFFEKSRGKYKNI